MSTTYTYTREQVSQDDVSWDVNHHERIDGNGDQILLADEINSQLTGLVCIKADGSTLTIEFESALSSGDKDTLDDIVSDHKNNV